MIKFESNFVYDIKFFDLTWFFLSFASIRGYVTLPESLVVFEKAGRNYFVCKHIRGGIESRSLGIANSNNLLNLHPPCVRKKYPSYRTTLNLSYHCLCIYLPDPATEF